MEYPGGYYKVNLNTYSCCVHGKACPNKDGSGSVRGEWQYHGYDLNGNRFSDIAFINDQNVTKFNQRDWIKEPWQDEYKPSTKLYGGISPYNSYAYLPRGDNVREWIGDTLEEWGGVPALSGTDPEVYKYLYVQSAPTIMYSGSGRMWHQRPTAVWYQSLSVPRLTDKQQLPVQAEATYVSGEYNPAKNTYIITVPESAQADSEIVYIDVTVIGTLKDEEYYSDEVQRTIYYTRQDIKTWDFTVSLMGETYTERNVPIIAKDNNTRSYAFVKRIPMTISQVKAINESGALGTVTARPTYEDNVLGNTGTGYFYLGKEVIQERPEEPIESITFEIPGLRIGNSIPEIAFDGIPFTGPTDNTDMSLVKSVELLINGQAVNYNTFFSGQYVFPRTTDRNGYLAQVEVVYHIDKEACIPAEMNPLAAELLLERMEDTYKSVDVVYVYPTKPIAHFNLTSNSWKENRIINVNNNSPDSNIQLVMQHYPITSYRWYYGGDTTKLHYGTNTDLVKQLQYSAPGVYSLTLEAQNTIGEWSDPYTVEFSVLEDYKPNIEVNLTDSVVTREDNIMAWHYDVNSTDGDKITNVKIELWYDADNNGTVDTRRNEVEVKIGEI